MSVCSKEFVESIDKLCKEAALPRVTAIPGDYRRAILSHGAEHKLIDLPPAPRDHHVNTLADFFAAVDTWGIERIYFTLDCIIGVIDDNDRRDIVTLSFNRDPRWSEVEKHRNILAYDHKSFVRWMRVTMRDTITKQFIDHCRTINFKQFAEGDSYIAAGSEKAGKMVTASVQLKGDLPEEIQLIVPMFTNYGSTESYAMSLALDIDPSSQKFFVQTPPGEIERIENAMLEAIRAELAGNCPDAVVLNGTP